METSKREFNKLLLCLKFTVSRMGGQCDYWPGAQKYLATPLVLDKTPYKYLATPLVLDKTPYKYLATPLILDKTPYKYLATPLVLDKTPYK